MAVKDSFRPLPRPNYRRRRVVAAVALVAVVSGVVHLISHERGSSSSSPKRKATATTGPLGKRSFLAGVVPAPAAQGSEPAVSRGVSKLEKRMPIERRVAQLFLVGFTGSGTGAPVFGDLARLDLGGLVIQSDNYTGSEQLIRLTAFAGEVAQRHKHVPPWLLTSQDGGEFSSLRGLPPADSPSAVKSVAQARKEAAQAAGSLHALGINGVLGPDVDVDTDPGGPYTDVTFSDDPNGVGQFGVATVRAYARQMMLTLPKHFPGLGAASQSTDDGSAEVGLPLNELAGRDLVPFKAVLDAGSQGVLLGHGLYTTDQFATPASESNALVTDLLRDNLRFHGIAVTDDLEASAITDTQAVPDAAVAALNAGADMVYISGPRADQTAAYAAVLNAVKSGKIPAARIEQAVLRILAVKQKLGLVK
jgi:beta-N-acetylhexosaminidase